jgi:hypothetical protein
MLLAPVKSNSPIIFESNLWQSLIISAYKRYFKHPLLDKYLQLE